METRPVRLTNKAKALCARRGVRIEWMKTHTAYARNGNVGHETQYGYFLAIEERTGRSILHHRLLRVLLADLGDDEIMGT